MTQPELLSLKQIREEITLLREDVQQAQADYQAVNLDKWYKPLKTPRLLALFFVFTQLEVGAGATKVDGTETRSLLLAISGPPVPVDSKVLVGYFVGLTDSQIETGTSSNAVFMVAIPETPPWMLLGLGILWVAGGNVSTYGRVGRSWEVHRHEH